MVVGGSNQRHHRFCAAGKLPSKIKWPSHPDCCSTETSLFSTKLSNQQHTGMAQRRTSLRSARRSEPGLLLVTSGQTAPSKGSPRHVSAHGVWQWAPAAAAGSHPHTLWALCHPAAAAAVCYLVLAGVAEFFSTAGFLFWLTGTVALGCHMAATARSRAQQTPRWNPVREGVGDVGGLHTQKFVD